MISIPVDTFEIIKPIFTGTDFSSDDLIFKCLYCQNRKQTRDLMQFFGPIVPKISVLARAI